MLRSRCNRACRRTTSGATDHAEGAPANEVHAVGRVATLQERPGARYGQSEKKKPERPTPPRLSSPSRYARDAVTAAPYRQCYLLMAILTMRSAFSLAASAADLAAAASC